MQDTRVEHWAGVSESGGECLASKNKANQQQDTQRSDRGRVASSLGNPAPGFKSWRLLIRFAFHLQCRVNARRRNVPTSLAVCHSRLSGNRKTSVKTMLVDCEFYQVLPRS